MLEVYCFFTTFVKYLPHQSYYSSHLNNVEKRLIAYRLSALLNSRGRLICQRLIGNATMILVNDSADKPTYRHRREEGECLK